MKKEAYRKTFHFRAEARPGDAWADRFQAAWPRIHEWFLKEGAAARPSKAACARALARHVPELKPMWRHLCGLSGGGDRESRFLSLWAPPNVFDGCSVAVVTGPDGPAVIRNYDFDPRTTGSLVLRSNWSGRSVIGVDQGFWGLLDGVNDDGLAVCLTFGGRRVHGKGVSVILVVRYILETCASAAEARDRLLRLRTPMQQSIVVLDAGGDHFTALLAPDRKARIWETAVTTNHPERVEWPEHARNSRSVERHDFLCERLGDPDLAGAFFGPPLYGTAFHRGMSTVYLAEYRPARGEAIYRWPGREVRQSFEDFSETELTVEYRDGKPAKVV